MKLIKSSLSDGKGVRMAGGIIQYLTRFKGYTADSDEWLTSNQLRNAPEYFGTMEEYPGTFHTSHPISRFESYRFTLV